MLHAGTMVKRTTGLSPALPSEPRKSVVAQKRAIRDALEARDVELARKSMAEHVRKHFSFLTKAVRANELEDVGAPH
jgi:DNA-binding GntR family transcriptional regulator